MIKRAVNLHTVKVTGDRAQPFRRFSTGIHNRLPIGIAPARCADKNRAWGHDRPSFYRIIAPRKTFLTLRQAADTLRRTKLAGQRLRLLAQH